MPSHTHAAGSTFVAATPGPKAGGTNARENNASGNATSATGGGGSHSHSFTGTSINLAVQYVDVIIASKD